MANNDPVVDTGNVAESESESRGRQAVAPPRFLRHPLLAILILFVVLGVTLSRAIHRFDETNALARGASQQMLSLELAPNESAARGVLRAWQSEKLLGCALRNLQIDAGFIATYALLGLVVAGLGWLSIPAGWRRWPILLLPLLAAVAGGADTMENRQLERAIHVAAQDAVVTPCATGTLFEWTLADHHPAFTEAIDSAREFALAKFLLLIGAWCGVIGIAGTQVVRFRAREGASRKQSGPSDPARSLEALHALELPESQTDACAEIGTSGEPRIVSRSDDRVGLALSGGGIRSATFNLGLLQGISNFDGVLETIDFLSTVSGGGYIGGAWSAWLSRKPREKRAEFFTSGNGGQTETDQVRHLREFSNFLIPRWGLFEVATWQAVVAVLAGLLPGVLTALSLLLLVLVMYLASTFYLSIDNPWLGPLQTAGLTAIGLFIFESKWRSESEHRRLKLQTWTCLVWSVVGILAVAGVLWLVNSAVPAATRPSFDSWTSMTGISGDGAGFSLRLFSPAVACALAALAFFVLRFALLLLFRQESILVWLQAFDRTLMRLLGFGALIAAMTGVWYVGVHLQTWYKELFVAAGGAGGLFALLRNWLSTLKEPQAPGIVDRLKPYVPQILAYATIVLTGAAIVSILVSTFGPDLLRWWIVAMLAATILFVMLFVDPQASGLHRFYRDRLARAYLGASLDKAAAENAFYDADPDDDRRLTQLAGVPHHLICCAANDLEADQVTSLSRGARSAVLSRLGISIGGLWRDAGDVTLASAVTASAAAFNSNMGSVSVTLGPGVTFLMCALNLRLGLWVRHPKSTRTDAALPGLLFYKEMLQLTDADGPDDVHLSDGGHFENLGLYELVRRHCRYIIVSDASADPDLAFDDFGVTTRRIRQDFGVEIDIDLSPLKPDEEGCARQHVVVGTINYNDELDKGVLLYVKPTLTGDEEPDIRQYRRRNSAFPHESTIDQFYDEAQWESYRRLGVHTAESMFCYVDRLGQAPEPNELFQKARSEWYPTTAEFANKVLSMTGRLSTCETELRNTKGATIAQEIFPELEGIAGRASVGNLHEAEVANLKCLLLMLQLMEDTWVACELDTQWNHPLNLGWMNLFARWATAPTFQMWWPVLSPMYGSLFLRFMRERFPGLKDLKGPLHRVTELAENRKKRGLAETWWEERQAQKLPANGTLYAYTIQLTREHQLTRKRIVVPLQVGLVAVEFKSDQTIASWRAEDFFIPPSLWNGGIGSRFLRDLIDELRKRQVKACHVTIDSDKRDPASRAEQLGYIDFYKGYSDRRDKKKRFQQNGKVLELEL